MDAMLRKLRKTKILLPTDVLGSSPKPATSTSTVRSRAADRMPSVSGNTATPSVQVIQAPGVTTADELHVSASINDPAPVEGSRNKSRLLDVTMQTSSGSMELRRNPSHSGSSFFANAQKPFIAGGTYVNCETFSINNPPGNTGEGQMKIPVPQKPNSSLCFTGRKDVLDKLENIFLHRAMSRRSCLLWGMGGIGKTQICLKFTEKMSTSFSRVFWVDASSHQSIEMSFKGISSVFGVHASGLDGSVGSALNWISCIQEEWLLVFDNADDPPPDMVAKFIPPGNRGNILITSRNRSMGRVVSSENIIEIKEMEEPDAIALLLNASHLDPKLAEHQQAAQRIVSELGCIPLAIDHAGAYIEAGNCDISNYLRQLSLHHQTIMSDGTFRGASNYDRTVYGTWDLSFKEIEKRAGGQSTTVNAQAAQAAILILQICAFYHHSNISKEIFQSAAEEPRKCVVDSEVTEKLPQANTLLDHTLLTLDNNDHWDDFIFGQGIGVLLSFSLMKREQSSGMFSIHPLVHCWSREQMTKSEQERICQMGSIILSCAIPQRFASQDYALRQLIFPHIKANESYRSQMEHVKQYYDDKCTNFALVMGENGDWNNAEHLEVQVMDMRKKLLGAEHQNTLRSMANLAITYRKQGKWNKAEHLEVQVMNTRRKLLGVEHPDTLTSMGNLASTYRKQGRKNEAEKLEVQVMDMRKELFGVRHPDTLTSIGNLASTYYNQGRLDEAEKLSIQVVKMMEELLGIEHPDTLRNMANLARTYRKQGRKNEAEQLEVQVMETRKKFLGAEHPETLTSMGNLAITYHRQGRLNEAEQLGIQVMTMMKKVFGAEHPSTLRNMENLAKTYHKQGRKDEAEQLELEVVTVRQRIGKD